jgi:hypothetical protein
MKTISIKDNSKKTSLIQSLESTLATRRKSQAELFELGELLLEKYYITRNPLTLRLTNLLLGKVKPKSPQESLLGLLAKM